MLLNLELLPQIKRQKVAMTKIDKKTALLDKSFYNKNVLITGTNRGLGKSLVQGFASEGANIYAHARTTSKAFIDEMKTLSIEFGVTITPIFFDLTDYDAMKSAMFSIMKSQEKVDVLVNSAGVAHGGFLQGTPIQIIKNVFDVNLFSTIQLTQLVVKIMLLHKTQASIINISSIAGYDLEAGNCAYGMSKASVISLTKLMAKEYTPQGIRVNAIAPGLLETDMADQMEAKAKAKMIDNSLMKRLGKTEEIVNVALFLASDKASFISGQTIRGVVSESLT